MSLHFLDVCGVCVVEANFGSLGYRAIAGGRASGTVELLSVNAMLGGPAEHSRFRHPSAFYPSNLERSAAVNPRYWTERFERSRGRFPPTKSRATSTSRFVLHRPRSRPVATEWRLAIYRYASCDLYGASETQNRPAVDRLNRVRRISIERAVFGQSCIRWLPVRPSYTGGSDRIRRPAD